MLRPSLSDHFDFLAYAGSGSPVPDELAGAGDPAADQELTFSYQTGGPVPRQRLNRTPSVSDAALPPPAAARPGRFGARPPVWLYYERLSDTAASCRFCRRVIRGAPTSSGNFWVHLKRLHAAEIARLGGEHAALVASWREGASRRRAEAGAAVAAMAAEVRQVHPALQGAPRRPGTEEEAQWMGKTGQEDISELAWMSPPPSVQEAPPASSQPPV